MTEAEVQELRALLEDVNRLRRTLRHAEIRHTDRIAAVLPRHRNSARNLIHYTELRRHDIRDLQSGLAKHGLSSLGRTEPRVLPSVDTVARTLARLVSADGQPDAQTDPIDHEEILARNAVNLLGPEPEERGTRIMVTLPSEASTDPDIARGMIERGMDLARINCAHDTPQTWRQMIDNIRAAEEFTGRRCLVSMDLAGPKLRTGPIRPGPRVLRVKPVRNETGTVTAPARVWLGTRPETGTALPVIPLQDENWTAALQDGQTISFKDARGARRTLVVDQAGPDGCLAALHDTSYFIPGTGLTVAPQDQSEKKSHHHTASSTLVGDLPALEESLMIRRGDTIILSSDLTPTDSNTVGTHRIGCTLPGVFTDVNPGERIWFDDGKIGGVITGVRAGELTAEMVAAAPRGSRLRAEKGINLPDTRLSVPALTDQDLADLEHVKELADIVSMSFVRSEADVRDLLTHLDPVRNRDLDIMLKIETVAAFEALPEILLELMKWADVGVMIARGDLAVEAGFERLAEVQEEILWLCEAAHVPVIWATQVLDTLARTGQPSRAEVTDAAMAQRAECVMLNKGPFINEAISMLADILGRMKNHTQKKRSMLRRLRAWDR